MSHNHGERYRTVPYRIVPVDTIFKLTAVILEMKHGAFSP